MRIRLERRLTPSRFMQVATPIASVLLTMALGAIIFQLIGFDGPRAIYETFVTPVVASYKWQDVATKAAPLMIIALGLSLGNQARSGTSELRGSTSSARLPALASRSPSPMGKASGSSR